MKKSPRQSKPYPVGYCKTPVHTRFQPGQSGNPKGRPKGRKNPLELVDKVLAMKVNVSDGRSLQRVSILEAAFRSMAAKAAKGDLKAVQLMLNLVEQARALEPQHDLGALATDDLAIIEQYRAQLQGGSQGDLPKQQTDPSAEAGDEEN
jgi:hypothetical protein